jgi:DNA-binding transcriptional MerR regulator
MITISQLARHAGVTVRAVRHYHQIGLLPEPGRDVSGYRTYDAEAVVRLIRIRILADAGVPLARVQELLDADEAEFARAVTEIGQHLRSEIRRLQENRRRIAGLAAGEQLALPESVVGYLARLRGLGVDERYVKLEADSWIVIAAQAPHQIEAVIADKHAELDDPAMVELYLLLSQALDWPPGDPRVVQIADLLEPLMLRAVDAGQADPIQLDGSLAEFLDNTMVESSPLSAQLLEILEKRGWKGWTNVERVAE